MLKLHHSVGWMPNICLANRAPNVNSSPEMCQTAFSQCVSYHRFIILDI